VEERFVYMEVKTQFATGLSTLTSSSQSRSLQNPYLVGSSLGLEANIHSLFDAV
jgi:hypothetical protein